jgi:hypothetical protein
MQTVLGGLAQHTFVLTKLNLNRLSLRAKGRRIRREKFNQGADSEKSVWGVVPLGLGQVARPIGAGNSLLQQQCHGVFIRGKELKKRSDMEPLCQTLQSIFVAGQSLAVDKDIVTGVIPFNNNVQTGCHRIEFSGVRFRCERKLCQVTQSIT